MSPITYRPATLEDAALAADLMTAAYPDLAEDPVIMRDRWDHPREGHSYGRFIAEMGGRPIAFLDWLHVPWAELPERNCNVDVWLSIARCSTQSRPARCTRSSSSPWRTPSSWECSP